MKRFPVGRLFGIGVGVGLASLAIYQHTATSGADSAPDSFQVDVSEFRSLAELENSKISVFKKTKTASLVGFDSNENDGNQIVLPVTEPLDSDDILLAPELVDEGTMFNEMPSADEMTTDVAGELAGTARQPTSLVENEPVPAALPTNRPLRSFSASINSAWKANPFTGESTAAEEVVPNVGNAILPGGTEFKSVMEVKNEYVQESAEDPSSDLVVELQTIKDSQAINNGSGTPELRMEEEFENQAEEKLPVPSRAAEELPLQQVMQFASSSSKTSASFAPFDMGLSQSVAQRAAQHIEYGKALARRGASSAARQEFLGALTTLAQANDAKVGGNQFSMALRKGIMAIKEAEDFVARDVENQIALDVAIAIETHRCGAMTMDEAQNMASIQAMQRYFAFAQHQMNVAAGQNVVAAEALFCLGKLHTSVVQADPTSSRLDVAKAIVFHQSALACDRNNFRSANELGVLMARSGRLAEARDMLKKSLVISPGPEAWSNLAKVHERLGEPKMAALAKSELNRALNSQPGSGIQWVNAQAFNANAPVDFHETIAARPNIVTETPVVDDVQEKSKSIGQRWKDMIKKR